MQGKAKQGNYIKAVVIRTGDFLGKLVNKFLYIK